jgi:hypothetical protein
MEEDVGVVVIPAVHWPVADVSPVVKKVREERERESVWPFFPLVGSTTVAHVLVFRSTTTVVFWCRSSISFRYFLENL